MSQHVLDTELTDTAPLAKARRRQSHGIDERLILKELASASVIDHLEPDDQIALITFGTVRETCPKCQNVQLKLVLRQQRVRLAHLFCADCQSCFDAHYANGASALTI